MKVELKTAKVLEAERMPKSQRLLKLKVDAGEAEPRTILAGIAESYEPEAMVGKSIVIVANLAPRKMMGLESNGMVLAASPRRRRGVRAQFGARAAGHAGSLNRDSERFHNGSHDS